MAGSIKCDSDLVPNRSIASCSPANVPGTPAARQPNRFISFCTLPSGASGNMSSRGGRRGGIKIDGGGPAIRPAHDQMPAVAADTAHRQGHDASDQGGGHHGIDGVAPVDQYPRADFGALRLSDDKAGGVAGLCADGIRRVHEQPGGAAGL